MPKTLFPEGSSADNTPPITTTAPQSNKRGVAITSMETEDEEVIRNGGAGTSHGAVFTVRSEHEGAMNSSRAISELQDTLKPLEYINAINAISDEEDEKKHDVVVGDKENKKKHDAVDEKQDVTVEKGMRRARRRTNGWL
jgi:hypothetical protein